jgi:hypothetical protein
MFACYWKVPAAAFGGMEPAWHTPCGEKDIGLYTFYGRAKDQEMAQRHGGA